jgi:hypothetical protein
MNPNLQIQRTRLNELSGKIIGLCIEVHRELGPGLLESAYEECLAYELSAAGLQFERQRALPLRYKAVQLDCAHCFALTAFGFIMGPYPGRRWRFAPGCHIIVPSALKARHPATQSSKIGVNQPR